MDYHSEPSKNPLQFNLVPSDVSQREREFLVLICDPAEHTYKKIADHMKVHRRTVDGYREAMFQKFGIRSKVGLALFAVKCGVVKV